QAFTDRANVFFTAQDYERAADDCTQAIRLSPNDALPYVWRGFVRGVEKRYDEALADFDEALRLNPKSSDALAYRAGEISRRGQPDKAMEDMDAAIALEDYNP